MSSLCLYTCPCAWGTSMASTCCQTLHLGLRHPAVALRHTSSAALLLLRLPRRLPRPPCHRRRRRAHSGGGGGGGRMKGLSAYSSRAFAANWLMSSCSRLPSTWSRPPGSAWYLSTPRTEPGKAGCPGNKCALRLVQAHTLDNTEQIGHNRALGAPAQRLVPHRLRPFALQRRQVIGKDCLLLPTEPAS